MIMNKMSIVARHDRRRLNEFLISVLVRTIIEMMFPSTPRHPTTAWNYLMVQLDNFNHSILSIVSCNLTREFGEKSQQTYQSNRCIALGEKQGDFININKIRDSINLRIWSMIKHTILTLLILESLFHLKNTYQHDPFYPICTLHCNNSICFIILA